MTSILDALSSEEFDIEVGPLGPAPMLRQRLLSMPQVQAVMKALREGELTEEDVGNHVWGLCCDFRTVKTPAPNLALSAIAVVMEGRKTDFAEGFLKILSSLRLAELTTASHVSACCLKNNRSLLGDYVTRKEHGIYPVGSKCVAYSESPDVLILKMEDGGVVELDGRIFYCPGLMPARNIPSARPSVSSTNDIMEAIQKQVSADIDKEVFADIDKACEKVSSS